MKLRCFSDSPIFCAHPSQWGVGGFIKQWFVSSPGVARELSLAPSCVHPLAPRNVTFFLFCPCFLKSQYGYRPFLLFHCIQMSPCSAWRCKSLQTREPPCHWADILGSNNTDICIFAFCCLCHCSLWKGEQIHRSILLIILPTPSTILSSHSVNKLTGALKVSSHELWWAKFKLIPALYGSSNASADLHWTRPSLCCKVRKQRPPLWPWEIGRDLNLGFCCRPV